MTTVNLAIQGMTCTSCEVLIERKLKKIPGVEKVTVNHASGRAELECSSEPPLSQLQEAVKDHGYTISLASPAAANSGTGTTPRFTTTISQKKEYLEIAGIFIILIGLYVLLKQFDFLPPDLGVSENLGYGVAFGMGLLAAVSTCLAVTGGLLVGVASKYAEQHPDLTGYQKFKPHIYFNIGRVVSYTLLGAGVGAIGSLITLSPMATGILTIIVSIVMVILGLKLLNLFPWMKRFQPTMPKFIAHRIYDASHQPRKGAPFVFGALTFFLPCGFTQALQLYILSQGNAVSGALIMLAFSLGTLPGLVSLGAVSSFAQGTFKRYFLKFAGASIILLGILSINSGIVLTGNAISFPLQNEKASFYDLHLPVIDGKQIVQMEVAGLDYYPAEFKIYQGVPVEWQIDGRKAQGCARVISVPRLRITEALRRDEVTTITFTPEQTGTIQFSCSMGMAGPGTFTVIPAP